MVSKLTLIYGTKRAIFSSHYHVYKNNDISFNNSIIKVSDTVFIMVAVTFRESSRFIYFGYYN